MKNKQRALKLILTQIEKQFGNLSIDNNLKSIPTGLLDIDLALGVNGLPRGQIIEIFGAKSSGKTSLTYNIISETQYRNGVAVFIDVEHSFDSNYAAKLGINLNELFIFQPDNGEQVFEIIEALIRSNTIDLIVVDSIAALTPKTEINEEKGQQARIISQALRKLIPIINKSKTCIVFINQIREKIGGKFGSCQITPGGRALKFYSSIRIDLKKIGIFRKYDQIIGIRIKAKIVKNKVAAPFKEADFNISCKEGIFENCSYCNGKKKLKKEDGKTVICITCEGTGRKKRPYRCNKKNQGI